MNCPIENFKRLVLVKHRKMQSKINFLGSCFAKTVSDMKHRQIAIENNYFF